MRARNGGIRSALPLFGIACLCLGSGMAGGTGGSAFRSSAVVRSGRLLLSSSVVTGAGYSKTDAANWSGYAQHTTTKGRFTAVEDDWVAPAANPPASGTRYAAQWVGIGGYSDATLVQAGTLEIANAGKVTYQAWTEILPDPSVAISGLTISKGNRIKTVVEEISTNLWKMTVSDLTTGRSGGRTVSYNASGESAEAILERPVVGSGLATLATTALITFEPGYFSTAGAGHVSWRPLAAGVPSSIADLTEISMTDGTNKNGTKKVVASPSAPKSSGSGFSVADGSKSPPAPGA